MLKSCPRCNRECVGSAMTCHDCGHEFRDLTEARAQVLEKGSSNNEELVSTILGLAAGGAAAGGPWLREARLWMQHNKNNGEHVTWGSSDVLHPHVTAGEMENVVCKAAQALAIHLKDKFNL